MVQDRKTNVVFYTTSHRLSRALELYTPAAKKLKMEGYPRLARELRQRQYDNYESNTEAKRMLLSFVRVVLCTSTEDADEKNKMAKIL